MTAYEAREIAYRLIDGGWCSADREQFAEENAKQEPENVMSEDEITAVFEEIESIELAVKEQYHCNMDSFGQDCPMNWEDIAAALNAEIDKLPYNGDKNAFADAVADLWERYCAGELEGMPKPVFEE